MPRLFASFARSTASIDRATPSGYECGCMSIAPLRVCARALAIPSAKTIMSTHRFFISLVTTRLLSRFGPYTGLGPLANINRHGENRAGPSSETSELSPAVSIITLSTAGRTRSILWKGLGFRNVEARGIPLGSVMSSLARARERLGQSLLGLLRY